MGGRGVLVRIVTQEQEQQDELTELARLRDKAMHLELALGTSRDIGVAIGIIMATEKVTRDCAFTMLRMVSQHTNRKISVLALEVIETGALPVPQRPSA